MSRHFRTVLHPSTRRTPHARSYSVRTPHTTTTALPLLGSIPIPVGGGAIYPPPGKCFACRSADHPRQWIPAPDSRKSQKRTLVLCFDGTEDSFDQDNSNVVQFLAMLRKDDPAQQLVYYQAGVGTYTKGVVDTPSVSKLLDIMFASNIAEHIKEGYQFLMQNYHEGDEICIFGFSRGAMTARALAGMLQKVGLLPMCNFEQLPFAYDIYKRVDYDGLLLSLQFKRTFSNDVRIKFVGVWDTVHSVGLIEKHMPFSGTNNAISYFRHALALDERRVKFRPFFRTGRSLEHKRVLTEVSEYTAEYREDSHTIIERRRNFGMVHDFEVRVNSENGSETDIREVFFAGAHCDVGGGSVKNGTRHSLARIPLRWMIRECFKVGTGIIFDAHMLKHEVGLDIDPTTNDLVIKAPEPLPSNSLRLHGLNDGELKAFSFRRLPVAIISGFRSLFRWVWGKLSSDQLPGSKRITRTLEDAERKRPVSKGERREELDDALSPIVDQIRVHPAWNIVEWLPWLVKRQEVEEADSLSSYKWIWNRGKGRELYKGVMEDGIMVHRSVRSRMQALPKDGSNKEYSPKVRFTIDGKPRCLTRKEWLADTPEHFKWVDD